ncbi:MAG: molybdenum cofactor guanylyltransferase [Myxococcales bacterium]|nr:molybdenum cofactor guanylyltransferase [Myxococcales bacterium]
MTPTAQLKSITAIILAGGLSRRMGSDKALVELRGQSLLHRMTHRLNPHVAEVMVVTRDRIWEADLPVRWIFDAPGRSDTWGAIVTGLEATRTDYAFVCAVDMPGLHLPLVGYLVDRFLQGNADATVPEGPKGIEPLHAVYHRRCWSVLDIAHAQGQRRLQELDRFLQIDRVPILALQDAGVWVDWALGNANTPAELSALDAQLPAEKSARISPQIRSDKSESAEPCGGPGE